MKKKYKSNEIDNYFYYLKQSPRKNNLKFHIMKYISDFY